MDVEKTIQFLLEQQAKFDARQAQLEVEFDKRQAESVARHTQFDEDIARIHDLLTRVAVQQERTNEILVTLAEKHVQLAEKHAELADKHAELARSQRELSEAQKDGEQRLSALISVVERHITNHN